jgi:CHAD domain-containing protein
MAFELAPDVSTTKAVRAVIRQRLDKAIELLDGLEGETDQTAVEEAVHDARKRCKEVRSVARLVRGSIGDDAFGAFNSAVRDAATELGPIRDSHAVLGAFDQLLKASGRRRDPALSAVRAEHAAEADRATSAAVSDLKRIEGARRLLTRARRNAHRWSVPCGFPSVADGIELVYRSGRAALRTARSAPTDDAMHEWRKAVKRLFHAMQLVEAAAPTVLSNLVEQLDRLGDLLGDDHDLAVLVERLGERSPEAVDLARQRQSELRAEAFPLGAILYAEKPTAFRKRIEAYWRPSR